MSYDQAAADALHENMQLRAQLAAAQAREQRLREALSRCRFDSLNMSAADLEFIRAVYAAKSDDSTLREMIEVEREACAKACDGIMTNSENRARTADDDEELAFLEGKMIGADNCATAIRARKG